MTDDLTRQAEEKSKAVEAIGDYLDLMGARRREPDHWERVFMLEAVNSLFRGAYGLATQSAMKAETPVAEQGDGPPLPTGGIFDIATIDILRRAFRLAEEEPLRAWPHLGHIHFPPVVQP